MQPENVCLTAAVPADGVVEEAGGLFQQPWWLDCVAPDGWGAVTVERGGRVVARLPYAVRRRAGLRLVTHPPLTQTLGPWLRDPEGKYAARLAGQHELLAELIDRLPPSDLCALTLAPGVTNALPFHWKNFRLGVAYTYRIEDLSNLDSIWAGFSEACRRAVRKAEKHVVVRDDLRAEAFCDVVFKTWARQGLRPPFTRELFCRLEDACRRRGAGRIFHAEDTSGAVHAAVHVVHDARTAYYLVGGGDPALRSSGAHSLLIWHAVRYAAGVSRAFDLEGSMSEPIERFFRSFGTRQTPLLRVRRVSRRMGALTALVDLAEACFGRRPPWFC